MTVRDSVAGSARTRGHQHQQRDTDRAGYLQRPGTTRVLERTTGGTVRRSVLPGGLRVVTEQIPGVRSASLGIWVQVGSRDEAPSVAGAAHYLEHLLFRGTSHRSSLQISEEIDAVGGELNAFTTKEHTCFYAHVLDEDLPLAVDVVSDVVFNALCTAEDMETERSIVLEEIAMYDDDPEDLLADAFCVALYGNHPLGRSVLGTEQSIKNLSRSALYGFYRRRYTMPRMVLAVAGNIEHGQVIRLVRKALGSRLVGDYAPVPFRAGRARIGSAPRLVLHPDDTEQAHIMLGVRGLDRHDPRRFAMEVLNTALGVSMSSRLFQEVRERRGLAYHVYSSTSRYADTGNLAIYAGCQPDRLGEVTKVIRSVLDEVALSGLSTEEITRAKGQLRGGLVLGLEDTSSRMSRIGKGELNHGQHLTIEQNLERIHAVSEAEVAAIARELLQRPLAVSVVGPYQREHELPVEVREVVR